MIGIDSKHAEAHLNLGVLFANHNQFDEAENEYRAALSLNPTLVDAHYNLGVFYEFYRKDPSKALAQYRKYVDLGGTDTRVKTLLKTVEE